MPLRDSSDRISPPFLLGPNGMKLRYAFNASLDGLKDLVNIGIKARFPETAPEDALQIIGRDRGIVRGFNELSAFYRARLRRWLDDWRTTGSSFAIMVQLLGYEASAVRLARVVFNAPSGTAANWSTIDNGTKSYSLTSPNNWDWDGTTTDWSRCWIILYSPVLPWAPEANWGLAGEFWGDTSGSWGSSAAVEEVQSIRLIVGTWKPAHESCVNIIVSFDNSLLGPTNAPGAPMPDSTWGKYYKISGGNAVPSREALARYWDGV